MRTGERGVANRFSVAELLKIKLAAIVNVYIRDITELTNINVEAETQPALYVSWHGDIIDESRRAGKSALVTDSWAIILAMPDTRPENTLQAAGAIIQSLLVLLTDWIPPISATEPIRAVGAFKLCSSPPPFYKEGYSFYTILFSVNMSLN